MTRKHAVADPQNLIEQLAFRHYILEGGDAPEWREQVREFAEAVLEEAARTTLNEAVQLTGPGDDAYNMALDHAAGAIRALKPSQQKQQAAPSPVLVAEAACAS